MQRSTRGRRPPKHPDTPRTRNAAGAAPPEAREAAPNARPIPAPKATKNPAAPRAPRTGDSGPLRTGEAITSLRTACVDWAKVVANDDGGRSGTTTAQAYLAIRRALVALVRLFRTYTTPEGDALTVAALALGDVPARFATTPPAPLHAAELPPNAPTVAPSTPTAPTPRPPPASGCAERLESLLTDIAVYARTIEGAIGEARAEIEAAAPPARPTSPPPLCSVSSSTRSPATRSTRRRTPSPLPISPT